MSQRREFRRELSEADRAALGERCFCGKLATESYKLPMGAPVRCCPEHNGIREMFAAYLDPIFDKASR